MKCGKCSGNFVQETIKCYSLLPTVNNCELCVRAKCGWVKLIGLHFFNRQQKTHLTELQMNE